MSNVPPRGGRADDGNVLRQQRLVQLAGMSDGEFVDEVRSHRQARWRRASLKEHARKHWKDFEDLFGRRLSPSEREEATATALASWDRLLTELDSQGNISYAFAARWTQGYGILVVVTRAGKVRTALPMADLGRWLTRHPAIIEVTECGKRLGP